MMSFLKIGSTSCDDSMLLHFPFNNHLNDVTCNKAISSTYGQGTVSLVTDANRGTVANFTNGYLEVRITMKLISFEK